MRAFVMGCFAVALLMPATGNAAGVNLRWNRCFGEGAGVLNRAFACDAETGTHLMVGSFQPAGAVTAATAITASVDLASGGATLPAWWEFQAGGCRTGSLAADATANPLDGVCDDFGQGISTAVVGSYTVGVRGANTARVLITNTLPPPANVDLVAGAEYFAFNLKLNNTKTTGVGSCGGCAVGVCIVLNSVQVAVAGPTAPAALTAPGNGTDSAYVTWQGGGNPSVGAVTGCPAATPTQRSSWAKVKALYR